MSFIKLAIMGVFCTAFIYSSQHGHYTITHLNNEYEKPYRLERGDKTVSTFLFQALKDFNHYISNIDQDVVMHHSALLKSEEYAREVYEYSSDDVLYLPSFFEIKDFLSLAKRTLNLRELKNNDLIMLFNYVDFFMESFGQK